MSIQPSSRYSSRWHARSSNCRRVPPTSPSVPSQSQVVATAAAAVLLLLSPGTAAARIPLEMPPDYQERSQRDALRNLGTPAVTATSRPAGSRLEQQGRPATAPSLAADSACLPLDFNFAVWSSSDSSSSSSGGADTVALAGSRSGIAEATASSSSGGSAPSTSSVPSDESSAAERILSTFQGRRILTDDLSSSYGPAGTGAAAASTVAGSSSGSSSDNVVRASAGVESTAPGNFSSSSRSNSNSSSSGSGTRTSTSIGSASAAVPAPGATGQRAKHALTCLAEARTAVDDRQYNQALLLYTYTAAEYPDLALASHARVGRAMLLYQVGKTSDAILALEDEAAQMVGSAEIHAALAALLYEERPSLAFRAEEEWEVATSFDKRYSNMEFVRTAKHWPDRMVSALSHFLNIGS